MVKKKQGVINLQIGFTIYKDHISLYIGDTEEKFFCYDKLMKRVMEVIKSGLGDEVHQIPKYSNARINVVLTYANNPSCNYPFDVKIFNNGS